MVAISNMTQHVLCHCVIPTLYLPKAILTDCQTRHTPVNPDPTITLIPLVLNQILNYRRCPVISVTVIIPNTCTSKIISILPISTEVTTMINHHGEMIAISIYIQENDIDKIQYTRLKHTFFLSKASMKQCILNTLQTGHPITCTRPLEAE